jgi:hypothetical protein
MGNGLNAAMILMCFEISVMAVPLLLEKKLTFFDSFARELQESLMCASSAARLTGRRRCEQGALSEELPRREGVETAMEADRDYQEFRVWPERLNIFRPSRV